MSRANTKTINKIKKLKKVVKLKPQSKKDGVWKKLTKDGEWK